MFPQVYYVVNTMNGWDNVVAAYTSKEEAQKFVKIACGDEEEYRIRQISLEERFVEE